MSMPKATQPYLVGFPKFQLKAQQVCAVGLNLGESTVARYYGIWRKNKTKF